MKRPGYMYWNTREILARIPLQGSTNNLALSTGSDFLFPPNSRRVQILSDGRFRIGTSTTIGSLPLMNIPVGRWIEIPPLCDRMEITSTVGGIVYATVLAGSQE
jgi:hypothetical protein